MRSSSTTYGTATRSRVFGRATARSTPTTRQVRWWLARVASRGGRSPRGRAGAGERVKSTYWMVFELIWRDYFFSTPPTGQAIFEEGHLTRCG